MLVHVCVCVQSAESEAGLLFVCFVMPTDHTRRGINHVSVHILNPYSTTIMTVYKCQGG